MASLRSAHRERTVGGTETTERPEPHTDRWAKVTGWIFAAPALVIFTLTVVAPLGYAVWVSFFTWDGISPARFAGLDNFAKLPGDDVVKGAFLHSVVLMLFYSVGPICIGLVLAAIISRQTLRWSPLWRTLLFLPQVLSLVVVGIAWQWLLAESGPVNTLLRAIGLGGITRSWLGDFTFALPAEGAIGTWLMTGLCMVLLLAGAQALDPSLYDAASVDGAGTIRQFWHVTVPGLRRVIGVCFVLTAASSLNNFGLIWVTTQGGPGDSTQVLATAIYTRGFVRSELGTASALALVVFTLMMLISVFAARRTDES